MGRVRGTGFFSKATISDLKIPSEFFRYNIAYILLKEGRGRGREPCTASEILKRQSVFL